MSDDLIEAPGDTGLRTAWKLLLEDTFAKPLPPGAVVGSATVAGGLRLGVDRERVLSVDHDQLRIGWLRHAGWGRAALAYGPFEQGGSLLLAVRALNGLTTSQTDPRPEGGRAMVRRWAATFPRSTVRRSSLRDNLMIGWFTQPVHRSSSVPVAAVVHRAGEDETGELWFQVGAQRVRAASNVQNLPATYVVALSGRVASLHAWSHPGAHGFAGPLDRGPLAELELEVASDRQVFAGVQQSVLGEVGYRVDTRIDAVHVVRTDQPAAAAAQVMPRSRWWEPEIGPPTVVDHFRGPPGDLSGERASEVGARWDRVLGQGVIERVGMGRAAVRATLAQPNPGRTAYCVPWDVAGGVQVEADIIPPGTQAGEGHRGRGGLVIWQDEANHLVVNHFIDDGSVGVSISAFLRSRGREVMYEWDAVWSNVGARVQRGKPFRLAVACDGLRFLCRVDGEPILYRDLTDYRADVSALEIRGVGLVANWEWGDDTGTEYARFRASPLVREPRG